MSTGWTLRPPVNPPDPAAASLQLDYLHAGNEARESYRRDLELEFDPNMQVALASDRGAIDLAQGAIKTATLLNGGGLLAIPAIITLFGLDARSVAWRLVTTATLFIGGLVAAWVANFCGFFALAARTDAFEHRAYSTRARIARQHYATAPEAQSWLEQEAVLDKKWDKRRAQFVAWRWVGIILLIVSLVFFLSAAIWGAMTVLQAQQRTVAMGSAGLHSPSQAGVAESRRP